MPTGNYRKTFSFPDHSFSDNAANVSFDRADAYEVTLAAINSNNTGTLSTRTDNDTGVASLTSGHTIGDGNTVDVYWSGGVRYGMTASVSGNEVTIDGGAGDNLPVQDTAITVTTRTRINCSFDGDNIDIIGVFYRNTDDTGAKAHVDFQDSGSNSINEVDLVHEKAAGGLNQVVNVDAGDSNTYSGNAITKAFASHDSEEAATIYILVGLDATP